MAEESGKILNLLLIFIMSAISVQFPVFAVHNSSQQFGHLNTQVYVKQFSSLSWYFSICELGTLFVLLIRVIRGNFIQQHRISLQPTHIVQYSTVSPHSDLIVAIYQHVNLDVKKDYLFYCSTSGIHVNWITQEYLSIADLLTIIVLP